MEEPPETSVSDRVMGGICREMLTLEMCGGGYEAKTTRAVWIPHVEIKLQSSSVYEDTRLLFLTKAGRGLGPAVNASKSGHITMTFRPSFARYAEMLNDTE